MAFVPAGAAYLSYGLYTFVKIFKSASAKIIKVKVLKPKAKTDGAEMTP